LISTLPPASLYLWSLIWAMQRVHRALPADGELAYAPIPWVVERQGEPRERGVGIHAYPSGLEQLLTEPNGVVHKMQEDVRQCWAQQLAKQRQSDAVAVAQARNIRMPRGEGEREATFDQLVEAAAGRIGKGLLTAREMGSLAPQWTKRTSASHQDGGISNGGEYDRALAEAEAALHAQKAAEFGDEWLEVYSDASVQLGSQSSEDKCGVGVWVAHKANTKGARGALVQAERSVAVHLA
jgi:hypothetical protein